ncbi:dedicator of cytokinesis protein 5-like [Malurus melanocephalus]|uniref:dedicator of cytokinesis protein 5-like n=1 Tax=Malurus melanocephalus TaxID=175006 RepID=UPI002549A70E|nr:dedicator of cytokinesis protein 5-like [Malurus melanocephalus]
MGGYSNYEKAFFTDKYLQEHPEDQDKIELLKQQIAIQMPLLAEGIRLHGEKLTEQLKPLHERLCACFRELRTRVEKHYGIVALVRDLPVSRLPQKIPFPKGTPLSHPFHVFNV